MEHAEITLSIIVPVYNVMAYLRPCLDGLLNQAFRLFLINIHHI